MKILVVGVGYWSIYEQAFIDAFRHLGHDARLFGWIDYYRKAHAGMGSYRSLLHRLDYRLLFGPITQQANRELIEAAVDFVPDIVFVHSGTRVLPHTLKDLHRRLPGTVLIQYSNDNPFSKAADPLLWRHLKAGLPLYDINFVYRQSNIEDVRSRGGKNVSLLRSYFIPSADFRELPSADGSELFSDVLFAGHYEADARVSLLEAIAELPCKLNLHGGGWERARKKLVPSSPLQRFMPVRQVLGAEYRQAICGTKIALCFLSKLNQDTYTRRNFQIPAMGTFMLSEYTEDLATLFEEGRDAEFFRCKEELVDKVKYYLAHDRERQAIAGSGQRRVHADGHDIDARARMVLESVEKFLESRSARCG